MKISQILLFFVCLTIATLAVIGGGQQPDYSESVTLTPEDRKPDPFEPTLAPQQMAVYNVTIEREGPKDGINYILKEDTVDDPNPSVTNNPAANTNLLWVWNDQASGGGTNPNYEFKVVNTIWEERSVTVTVKCTWVPVLKPGEGDAEGEVPEELHGKAEGIAEHLWGDMAVSSNIAVQGAPDYLCIHKEVTLSSWLVRDDFEHQDYELIESNWSVEGLAPSYGGGTIEPNPDHTVVFTPTNTGLVRVTATESLYSTNSGYVEFTIVEVEIEPEDEPGDLICVGGTKEYTAVVTPTNVQGTFTWRVSDEENLDIVGANNQQTVTVTGKQASASASVEDAEELTVEFSVNGELICEPSTNLTVVDFTKLRLATSDGARFVEDETPEDEPPSVTNTLYLAESTNGVAVMTIEGWWEPTGIESNRFLWQIVLTNETADPPEWDVTSSSFTTNPVTVTWDVADAAGGVTNREFIVRGWYDCDESGEYNSDFPHRELFATILKVDFLDKDKNFTTNLKVAKWQNAFDDDPLTVKEDFIDHDPDRFYVRVVDPSQGGAGKVSIMLSTHNDDDDYNDTETEIELDETGANTGIFVSKSLMLMADSVDDNHLVDGIADNMKNDRTHLIALGGDVLVKYHANDNITYEAKASVPIEKTVKVNHVILSKTADGDPDDDPFVDPETVETWWRTARERYAQVGVLVEWGAPVVVNWPTGENAVDLSDGLTIRTNSLDKVLTGDAKKVISEYGTDGEITFIYIYPLDVGTITIRGSAVAEYWYDPSEDPYLYNAFVSSIAGPFTAAHELLHLLANSGGISHQTENLLSHPTSTNVVTGTKRITTTQEEDVHGSTYTQSYTQ